MRSFLCMALLFVISGIAAAQTENYGPPFPVVPNGGSTTHNGWTLSDADNVDLSTEGRHYFYSVTYDGQEVLTYKVSVNYAGVTATQLSAAPGWSLSVGGTSLQAYGRECSVPEDSWSVGSHVTMWEERFWAISLAAKYEENVPGHGTATTFYGQSGHDWYGAMGRTVRFLVSDEPEEW